MLAQSTFPRFSLSLLHYQHGHCKKRMYSTFPDRIIENSAGFSDAAGFSERLHVPSPSTSKAGENFYSCHIEILAWSAQSHDSPLVRNW